MRTTRIGVVLLAIACGASATACCCPVGGRGHSRTTERVIERQPVMMAPAPAGPSGPATLGKQLEDLNAAFRKGVISREEYEAAKQRLLEQGAVQR